MVTARAAPARPTTDEMRRDLRGRLAAHLMADPGLRNRFRDHDPYAAAAEVGIVLEDIATPNEVAEAVRRVGELPDLTLPVMADGRVDLSRITPAAWGIADDDDGKPHPDPAGW